MRGFHLTAVVALAAACGETLPPLEGSCYTLAVNFPDSLLTGSMDSLETAPPSRVKLTDRRLDDQGGNASWAIEFVPGATPSVHSRRYWMRPARDSVVIVFSTGFAGVALLLKPHGNVLGGIAEAFFDYRGPATTEATATPVPCDAVIPATERYESHLFGEIQLTQHDSPVRVREPIDTPSIAIDSANGGILFLRSPLADVFKDATVASVATNPDGQVHRIDVWYLNGETVAEVVQELTSVIGPPTAGSAWVDRSFEIAVSEQTEPSQRVVVSLSRSNGH